MIKQCPVCNNEFVTERKNKTCSEECKKIDKRNYLDNKLKLRKVYRYCVLCNTTLKGDPNDYIKKIIGICKPCASEHNLDNNNRAARVIKYRLDKGILNKKHKKCTFCGKESYLFRDETKYPSCGSKECISKREKLLRSEKPKKYKEITCGVCGKKITVLAKSTGGKSSNKKYCSDKCRQIQEANRRKVYKEKIGIEKFREMNRAVNDRRRSDPVKKLICNIRTYLSMTLSKNQSAKGSNTFKILGYDADTLRRHLEKQFKDGMTWDNYGNVWHVDHRIPTDAFNFKQVDKRKLHEVIRKCWALDNLQPLDAIENMRKSNKILY